MGLASIIPRLYALGLRCARVSRAAGRFSGVPLGETLRAHCRNAIRAAVVIRASYFFPLAWMAFELLDWQSFAQPRNPEFLWPIRWMLAFDVARAGPVLAGAALSAYALGTFLCEWRWARALAFTALLEFLSLQFSLGKIHHLMHGWLLLSFALIWLPRGWARPWACSRAARHSLLLVYTAAQLLVAVTYGLAGVGKCLGAIYQVVLGEITSLHPDALALHIASRLLETNDHSLWGPWLIERGGWLWPMMLGTLYLQLFAVVFTLRPSLHRLLGVGLVCFHVMAPLALAIDFTPAIALCGLLYCASAVAPEQFSARRVLMDLPLLGPALRHAARLRRRLLVSSSGSKLRLQRRGSEPLQD